MSHTTGPSNRSIWARLWDGFKRIGAFFSWIAGLPANWMRRPVPTPVNEPSRPEARQAEPYPTALLGIVSVDTINALPQVLIGRQLKAVPDIYRRLEEGSIIPYYYQTPDLTEFGNHQVIRGMDLDDRPFISYKSLDQRGRVYITTLFPLELNPIGDWRVIEKDPFSRDTSREKNYFYSRDLKPVTEAIGRHLHSILSYKSASTAPPAYAPYAPELQSEPPPPYVGPPSPPQRAEANAAVVNPSEASDPLSQVVQPPQLPLGPPTVEPSADDPHAIEHDSSSSAKPPSKLK